MKNITCIIIDDEPLAIKLLENFVERTPVLTFIASYTDSVKALAALKSNPVDLVFLDIQMPDMDGMELSRMVPADTRVIFTTAFKDYAFDSYEVNALDFLLKPIRYNKFVAAVDKAKQWFAMAADTNKSVTELNSIFIRVDGELRRVSIDSIEYVSGMSDYVMFYLSGEKKPLITHLTMKSVEDLLPKNDFMRVHRSYIIALNKIRSIDRNNCIYIGSEVIHVTDAYLETFKGYLKTKFPGEKL
jgi:DNA-binding LytR/AlgR family response regulator